MQLARLLVQTAWELALVRALLVDLDIISLIIFAMLPVPLPTTLV